MRGILIVLAFLWIPVKAQVSFQVAVANETCAGMCNGMITVNSVTGTPPYTYSFNQVTSGSNSQSGLCPGSYTVEVTDANGITASETVTISGYDPIQLVTHTTPTICGDSTGTATTIATGGNGSYTFQYDLVDSFNYSNPVTGLKEGVFCLTVIDESGCFAAACVYITSVGGVNAQPVLSQPSTCPGTCNAVLMADTTLSGNPPPDKFYWKSSQGTVLDSGMIFSSACDGEDVTLYVENSNGCRDSANIYVPSLPPPSAAYTYSPDNIDLINPLVQFNAVTDASVTSITWNFPDGSTYTGNSLSHLFQSSGSQEVITTLTNSLNCVSYDTIDVFINPSAEFYFPNAFTPNKDGRNEEFGPLGYGRSKEEFIFRIFDRNGQVIFSSNKPDQHWNGKVGNTDAPIGMYVWQLQHRDVTGEFQDRRGHVMLIR